MLTGPASLGVMYRMQAGKPIILHSIPRTGNGYFSPSVQIGFVANPTRSVGTGGPIPRVKPPLCDADNLHPSSVNINPLTPELNSSAQRCLTRYFTVDFAS
jgi:hypothetical protein